MFQNPIKVAIQKYIYDLIRDRYGNHKSVLDRVCHYLVTESDAQEFAAFVNEIYQTGYAKASNEFSQKMKELNMNFQIRHGFKMTDDD